MAKTFKGLDLFLNYIDKIGTKAAMEIALDDLGRASMIASKQYISKGKVRPESRRAKEENGKTLLDTGRGRSSINYRVNVFDESVGIGTNVKYMKDHREGNNQKQREFLITADEKVIERIIAKWFGASQ